MGMINETLIDHIEQQPFTLRRAFMRLDGEQKRRLREQFMRHVDACRKNEMDIDPHWIVEAIGEAAKGYL